ncbi:MAG: hypothetical protein ACRC3H_05350 [Lachnospiraceae bacterium]
MNDNYVYLILRKQKRIVPIKVTMHNHKEKMNDFTSIYILHLDLKKINQGKDGNQSVPLILVSGEHICSIRSIIDATVYLTHSGKN